MESNIRFLNRLPGSRIFLVSSDSTIRQFFSEHFGTEYGILAAEDGSVRPDALLIQSGAICVVILDLQMPGLDGFVFLRKIRSHPMTASVPVIVLSANANPEQEQAYLEIGANDYIALPFHEKVFAQRVRNLARSNVAFSSQDSLEKDDLTRVYSKRAFLHRAKELLCANPQQSYDIAITDIDQFKLVNTIYGEEKANALLRELAACLQAHSAEGLCARYGSDQFIWLHPSDAEGKAAYQSLLSRFAEVSPVHDVSIRCGVYANVDRQFSIIRMCDNALFALRSIKNGSKEVIAFYDGPLSQRHYRDQFYLARFQDALKNNEFTVVYQPKYDPYTNRVVGAEALVRWRNPDGTVNMPGEFLSVFESNGLIAQLDEYVFRRVCRQQRQWLDAGLPLFPVSVNLSRNSIHQKDRAAVYAAIAREYNIDSRFLPIEITETTATDSLSIQKYAEDFQNQGFPLHMDDFGSEHSSLQTLNVLNFDVVKLDKGLIDYIGDKAGEMILTYIMALTEDLGIRIVAEGVETKQQLDFLAENGCDQIQGYYYSKPLPPEEFKAKVADNLAAAQLAHPMKEDLYILSRTSNFEKMMTQRMLPRIPGGFLIYEEGDDERIIYSNAYLWRLFGCEDEADFMEHVHSSFRGIVSPEELDRVNDSIHHQILSSEDDMDYVEYSIVRKDGIRVPVVDYGHLERTGKKNLFYVFIYKKSIS